MALTNSNTYIEPVQATSINIARGQLNNSLRSILTNFKSAAPPVGVNLTASGDTLGEQDGMLYRSATTNALYISDSVHVKSSPVGGNFTRVGIGNRVENGIVALGANATSYEIGELVATVSENGILAANSRLYLCTSNTSVAGSTSSFIDVGLPPGYSVAGDGVITLSGPSTRASRFLATSNVGVGTLTPSANLHVVGNARVQSTGFIAIPSGTTSQRPSTTIVGMIRHNSETDTFEGYHNSSWQSFSSITITSDASTSSALPITFSSAGTGDVETLFTSSAKLNFVPSTGTLSATNFNSLSDERLKTNIKTIDNALQTTTQLRGTYFEIDNYPSLGLIAQEVEKIIPEVVSTNEYKTISYGNLVGLLVEAIKELDSKVNSLEKRLEDLS